MNVVKHELSELKARQKLREEKKAVLDEVERKKKLAAYSQCLDDVRTTSITRKSTELTQTAVTEQLAKSFREELDSLNFKHLEIELTAVGGSRGVLYHRLSFSRASNIDLPKVVSEGEARALALAAFLAELSTAEDPSAILFDDPVSSLDHRWREHIARRLAKEALRRQVVVFTHDIVFLQALERIAEELHVDRKHQYIRREGRRAGLSSPDLPWIAMKVKDRIGALRNRWQTAEKVFRTESRYAYEREASDIYGHLREAWERAVEEVLLYGVIERYRPSIETQRARYLADITQDDLDTVDDAMTKCSRWLRGHDQPSADTQSLPEPDELKADIDALDTWVKSVRKRR